MISASLQAEPRTRPRRGARRAGEVSPTPARDVREAAVSFDAYLAECRALVVAEIRRTLPRSGRAWRTLSRLMLDYPLREAKGLRPTLAIATCRALGGQIRHILPSAAVLELYHNAFLVHDDVEDESLMRRGRATLHVEHGVPIAVNVGDAMLCLSLEPLLDNIRVVGLGPALRILQTIAEMTRETVAGQAMELEWVRHGAWDLTDADYVRMVVGKTGWYSFMTPVRVAAIVCGIDDARTAALVELARTLSVAFQIQDDVLNLRGEVGDYGKEIGGDLWEGKRTVMLLHMLRKAAPAERREALRILALGRPDGRAPTAKDNRKDKKTANRTGKTTGTKTAGDVRKLMTLIQKYRSLDHASAMAAAWTERAQRLFAEVTVWLPPSRHRDVLQALVDYVYARER